VVDQVAFGEDHQEITFDDFLEELRPGFQYTGSSWASHSGVDGDIAPDPFGIRLSSHAAGDVAMR
jgi:hypothetical protein